MENKVNYFIELAKLECEVEKRNWLSYISWANAWDEVKRVYPDATYEKIKNTNDNSYLFRSWTGGGVEVDVTINGITHRADLAVTGLTNQEIKYEAIKSTDIHNTLQRAFAKAIAMHGIGLYVYRGEDFPEETGHDVKKKEKKSEHNDNDVVIEWTEKHTCTKCKTVVDAKIFQWTYWPCFKCPECNQFSKPNSYNPNWNVDLSTPAF